MTNGEKIIAILKPRKDQIRIYGNYVEIEIQKLGINFSCGLDWWNAEYTEPSSSEKPNKSEIPTSSEKLSSELEKNSQKLEKGTDYTWEDVSSVIDAMEYRTNSLIENIKSEILHFVNAHCSGDDINIYDVFKVIDDCCETGNSTTKNDLGIDCIDRAKLLKIYEDRYTELQRLKHLKDNKGAEDRQLGVNYCINILKEIPSVTPIRPKGHWIKQNDDYYDWYECSECGYGSDGEMQYSSEYDVRTNYCPNCGSYNGGASNGNE